MHHVKCFTLLYYRYIAKLTQQTTGRVGREHHEAKAQKTSEKHRGRNDLSTNRSRCACSRTSTTRGRRTLVRYSRGCRGETRAQNPAGFSLSPSPAEAERRGTVGATRRCARRAAAISAAVAVGVDDGDGEDGPLTRGQAIRSRTPLRTSSAKEERDRRGAYGRTTRRTTTPGRVATRHERPPASTYLINSL